MWLPWSQASEDMYKRGGRVGKQNVNNIKQQIWKTKVMSTRHRTGTLDSHNNHPSGDLLVLWVHTTITCLVISWSLWVHTTITLPGDLLVLYGFTQHWPVLVISWSFGFTQHWPAWWSPGPLGSHNNHPSGALLVFWVNTTITRLVISWSFGFTQQSAAWWSPGPLGFTQQSPAWWSPGPLGSHNNQPPGDLLVLWVHTTITCHGDLLVLWVHTTITRLVISWYFGFTQQSPAWWSPGPLGSHNNHHAWWWSWSLLGLTWWIVSFLPGDLLVLRVHTTITCDNPLSLLTTYGQSRSVHPHLEIFPEHLGSLKAMLPWFVHGFVFAGAALKVQWSTQFTWAWLGRSGIVIMLHRMVCDLLFRDLRWSLLRDSIQIGNHACDISVAWSSIKLDPAIDSCNGLAFAGCYLISAMSARLTCLGRSGIQMLQ